MEKYFVKMIKSVDNTNILARIVDLQANKVYEGKATYHDGDPFSNEIGEKIARAKAWRKYWLKERQRLVKEADSLKVKMNESLDEACTCNKKMEEIDNYIRRLTNSKI